MATTRGFSRGRRVSQRRRTSWDEGPGSQAAVSITSSSSVILGSGAESTEDGLTIVRIRGLLSLTQSVGGALQGFSGAFGIGIVTTDAFTVGITAMPTPLDDMDWDGWMFHQFVDVRTTGTFDKLMSTLNKDYPVDSKAM